MTLSHADPLWSHFSTFGLDRAALKKGLCLTGSDLSRIPEIESVQPSAVLGDLRDPEPWKSNLVTFPNIRAKQSSFEKKGSF